MAETLSLDDLDAIGRTAQTPKKKKKSGIKAKSTAKVAKGAKVVSSVKIKKKKKKTGSMLDSNPDLDSLLTALETPVVVKKPKAAKPEKKKKEKPNAAKKEIEKKRKKKAGPVTGTELATMEAQVGELMADIPDVIKQENDQIAEYMIMFDKLRSMARECEAKYMAKKESRDIYALMQLYNQMREVIADLRALRDVTQLGDILNEEVLGPFAEASANSIVKIRQELLAWSNSHLSPDDLANFSEALDKIVKRNAKDIQTSYANGLGKTVQIFSASA